MPKGRCVDEVIELKRQGLCVRAIRRLTAYGRRPTDKSGCARGRSGEWAPSLDREQTEGLQCKSERVAAGRCVGRQRAVVPELPKLNNGSGYTIPTDWLRPQRKEVLWAVVQGFEAPPGKSTQADWGRLGILSEAGRVRKR